MIAAVTSAEKEERRKALLIEKGLKGYDPTKWLRSKVHIRNHEEQGCRYEKLRRSPPIMGIHKCSYCSGLYEDIRKFLDERMFTPAASDSNTSGVTWLELFLLFDTTGPERKGGNTSETPRRDRERKRGRG